MEVCGGHTHSIYKYGVDDLLPPNVELVHGPGCPVCVIPMGRVDDGIAVARNARGDLHLLRRHDARARRRRHAARRQGRGRRRAHGLLAARRAADRAREPRSRGRVLRHRLRDDGAVDGAHAAAREGRGHRATSSCFCNHVTIVPPLRALLESPDLRLDGFIGPGHVATVVGARPFEFIPADYGKPIVISGFEPLDLLQSVQMIMRQLARGPLRGREPVRARRALRGQHRGAAARWPRSSSCGRTSSGAASGSSRRARCGSRDAYRDFDAELRYEVPNVRVADPKACQCGEVLKGVIKPWECKVFGSACTPEHADRHVHGLARGRLRRVLHLRPLRARAGGGVTVAAHSSVSEREQRVLDVIEKQRARRPKLRDAHITMAHGAGGKATQTLIEGVLVPAFASPALDALADVATIEAGGARLAFTTDSFVVKPHPLPRRLDRRARGQRHRQRPRHGRRAAARAQPRDDPRGGPRDRRPARRGRGDRPGGRGARASRSSAGDTKVVERGHADSMYLCTTGHRPRRRARRSWRRRTCAPATACSSRARSASTARRSCWRAASSTSTPTSSPTRARCGRPSTRCSAPPGRTCAACATRRAAAWRRC